MNEILETNEKVGGLMRAKWQIRNLREVTNKCDLVDLSYKGYRFTWSNGPRRRAKHSGST